MLTNERLFARLLAAIRFIPSCKDLPPGMEDYLQQHMLDEPLCKKKMLLHEQDKVLNKAYFLISGYAMLHYFDDNGIMQVLRIYKPNQFIGVECLINRCPTRYSITAFKGAVLWSIDEKHMGMMMKKINGTSDYILACTDNCKEKELLRESFLNKGLMDRVKMFYMVFNGLLPAGSIMTDAQIASYLRIGPKTLRKIRKRLIMESLLK